MAFALSNPFVLLVDFQQTNPSNTECPTSIILYNTNPVLPLSYHWNTNTDIKTIMNILCIPLQNWHGMIYFTNFQNWHAITDCLQTEAKTLLSSKPHKHNSRKYLNITYHLRNRHPGLCY